MNTFLCIAKNIPGTFCPYWNVHAVLGGRFCTSRNMHSGREGEGVPPPALPPSLFPSPSPSLPHILPTSLSLFLPFTLVPGIKCMFRDGTK
jgi:hypothetical protein